MKHYVSFWPKIFTYSGRSNREEFWFPMLVNIILAFDFIVVYSATELPVEKMNIFALLVWISVLPTVSLTVRRMHDINKSGWLVLLYFVPIGAIIVLILTCIKGDAQANRFGAPSVG